MHHHRIHRPTHRTENLQKHRAVRSARRKRRVCDIEFLEQPGGGLGDASGVRAREFVGQVLHEWKVIQHKHGVTRGVFKQRRCRARGVRHRGHGIKRVMGWIAAARHDHHRAFRGKSRLVRPSPCHHPQVRLHEQLGVYPPRVGLATHADDPPPRSPPSASHKRGVTVARPRPEDAF